MTQPKNSKIEMVEIVKLCANVFLCNPLAIRSSGAIRDDYEFNPY